MNARPALLRSLCLAWLLGFVLAATILMRASPAVAACPSDTRSENSSANTVRRGVRSGLMKVSDTSIPCIRISTVIAWSDFDNIAEIGWYEDPNDYLTRCTASTGKPRLMIYSIVNGSINCVQNPPELNGGQFDAFAIRDANADTVWDYYHNNIYKGSYNLTFSIGEAITNGERKDGTGSMYSDFGTLQYWSAFDTAWVSWILTGPWDTPHQQDPEYEVCIYSDTHTAVELVC